MLTAIITILVFGFLIFIHEFGHYITARIFHVTIEEFSIGMGPRIVSWVSKKTNIRYTISLLPIGGFVSMPGENGEYNDEVGPDKYKDDPNTFGKKPVWQRIIITAAGAAVNIIAGFLAMILITTIINIGDTTVGEYYTNEELSSGYETELEVSSSDKIMVGDKILKIDGKRVRILDELSYEIMRRGNNPVDVLVERDGEEILLLDVVFPKIEEQGQQFGVMDFKVYRVDKNLGKVLGYSFAKAALIVRMCWESLFDLITGRYSFAAVSGPIGISSAIGDAAKAGFASLLYTVVLISINLGVMNLIPFPALDGGRLITQLIELVTKKKLPGKIEGIINAAGLIILLMFMGIVMIKDAVQLIL